MSKILFITTSPNVGGNGDVIVETAGAAAAELGAEITTLHVRDMKISSYLPGAGGEADDFAQILEAAKAADSIIVTAPIYFNLPSAPAIAVLNQFVAVRGPQYVPSGVQKKLAVVLTCGGSDPDKMKEIGELAVMYFEQVKECRVEVFNQLSKAKDVCKNTPEYLARAAEIGKWAAE